MSSIEKELGNLKWERRIGTIHYYLLVAQAAAGFGSAVSSVPLIILNAIPTWAEVAMAGGGSYFAIAGTYYAKAIKPVLNQVREEERELRRRVAFLRKVN